jgi:hypothetical protein
LMDQLLNYKLAGFTGAADDGDLCIVEHKTLL